MNSAKKMDILVLFSGGSDSTLAAALCAAEFKRVRLITYSRLGIAAVENSRLNAAMLMERFGSERISHEIINIDKLFKFVSYDQYWKAIRNYGFMSLSTCGLCKLAMHVMTVKYCLKYGINQVCDGANSGMTMFPDQMKPIITELQEMYLTFGIRYSNPVFNYAPPEEPSFLDQDSVQLLSNVPTRDSDFDKRDIKPAKEAPRVTTGQVLHQMGLAPAPNVKGTPYDRKRQPRCFQFILFNIFANKYYLNGKTYEEYQAASLDFFKWKIEECTRLLKDPGGAKHRKIFK